MQGITRLGVFDASSLMLRDPYRFISNQAKKLRTDVFETRLFFERTVCMTGRDAAQLFVDENLFQRKSAPQEPMAATLLGKGGVQGLDGEAHLHRKRLFMSFTGHEDVHMLQQLLREELDKTSEGWTQKNEIVLYEEFQQILARVAFRWMGLEISEKDFAEKTSELTSLFEAGTSVRKHFYARFSRKKNEKWLSQLISEIREGKHPELEGKPISIIAKFRDLDGKFLSERIAAVEVLNLLRPMIAVSVYFVFALHALHLHPVSRQRIRSMEAGFLDNFVNEVRRFYPFFPALTARVKQDFKWGRMQFKKGTRVMLDIYGTNHDADVFERPFEFNPDRFKELNLTPFNFIPQGVGDHQMDHRCPGEIFTIELMRTTIEYFMFDLTFDVPRQQLQIQMNRLPALPKSHLVISHVRRHGSELMVNQKTFFSEGELRS